METLETNLTPKNAVNACIFCHFKCCKKSEWVRHIKTRKHIVRVNGNILETLETNLAPKNAVHTAHECSCGKSYGSRSGLWKHVKICQKNKTKLESNYTDDIINKITDKDELILTLIKQNFEITKENSEFKNMMMKVIENGTNNHSHNTTNSHNKSFNLQFFLNETCKDAMNIMDFVDSIKLQLSDLEKVGEIGYVDGISNIIVKNLNALEVEKRPVHCTDKKREILYIKDENKWEKEDVEKNKLRKAIKRVACKNQRLIPKFKEAHPDCIKAASKFSDQYNKMIIESMGGSGDNDLEKEDKIIRNISKNVVIDKNI
uniref:C2H2-type domain-containing protein n=1 Tax=viral metagenome TaxID=1070528 RepID=A0A6C0AQL5_9ZZZZ